MSLSSFFDYDSLYWVTSLSFAEVKVYQLQKKGNSGLCEIGVVYKGINSS